MIVYCLDNCRFLKDVDIKNPGNLPPCANIFRGAGITQLKECSPFSNVPCFKSSLQHPMWVKLIVGPLFVLAPSYMLGYSLIIRFSFLHKFIYTLDIDSDSEMFISDICVFLLNEFLTYH